MQLTSAGSCAIINHVAAVMQQTKYKNADMAESADALASGASPRKGVEVQVLLSAPTLYFVCNSKFPCIEYADMAESADALASGASPRKGVEVQVLLSAPKRTLECSRVLFLSFYGKTEKELQMQALPETKRLFLREWTMPDRLPAEQQLDSCPLHLKCSG